MDLLSQLNSISKKEAIEPREIFMMLPSKAPGYGYPRDVQSEVWKQWYSLRNEKNIIIKMNTGSGKTVVGLMILQSSLNEKKGPAIYVVPDNYLVNQVLSEALRLGINATNDRDNFNYTNSKAILVTTIQTIVNGLSVFGMRSNNSNYPIGSIIIDDVHACMEKINSQFMINISSESKVYSEILNLFSDEMRQYDYKRYIDIVELKDGRESTIIPYWEWIKKYNEIYKILRNNNEDSNITFGLPLIEDCLSTCNCFISASEIEITPKGVDIDKIISFVNAERRIFMSATLSDDSVFISSLGLSMEDLKNIITPENANDIGDRLILFPKHINPEITEEEIKNKVEEVAEKYNVVVIVPSFERAKFWDPEKNKTVDRDNIDDIVMEYQSGKHVGISIVVNRYDGIDLPGEACRMLVIDGLPPLHSMSEKYIKNLSPMNTTILREQVQRIEQGMGRGVRSNDDECCIVLMGDELSDVLTREKGIDFFSQATRCQFELSKEVWELLVMKYPKPSVEQIFELADYSLNKNPVWVENCKSRLASVRYSKEVNIDRKVIALRKAFEFSLSQRWIEASKCIEEIKNTEKDLRTKGYLCQIQAEYTNMYDSALSQEILSSGKKLSGKVLSPIAGINYEKNINNISQAQGIADYLDKNRWSCNEIIIYVDSLLSKLIFRTPYLEFEDALNNIGSLLGFRCSRPDNETRGYGPDNLWAMDKDRYLIIECKDEATSRTISKIYCDQLSGSVNWFQKNYPNVEGFIPIIIHPSRLVDSVASPSPRMRVITLTELDKFKKQIRLFFAALCNSGQAKDVRKIKDLLCSYRLRAEDIDRLYTVEYQRE